jgi:hypothetical protein
MAFLTPAASPILVLALAAAGAVMIASLRRAARARTLGFSASRLPAASGCVTVAVFLLVALAAMQPAVLRSAPERSRNDVQAWIAIDTSNSMLASAGPGRSRRLAQAQADALTIRRRLVDLKVGLAVMTSRVLPLLPPTVDENAFAVVDRGSVKANTPKPLASELSGKVSTGFKHLDTVPKLNFYGDAKRKLLVVISDMETTAFDPVKLQRAYAQHHVALVLVQVGSAHDRVWLGGHEDAAYHPQRSAARQVAQLATASAGGTLFKGDNTAGVARRLSELAGRGPSSTGDLERRYLLLAPYLLLATFPLLTYVLAVLAAADLRRRSAAA